MRMMTCPVTGPRDIKEFVRGREVREMPDPATCSEETWAAHLFMDDAVSGEVVEWWMHAPSAYWFIARRSTVTDEVIQTYTVEAFFGPANADAQITKAAA